jgi:hypothetical protein
VLKGDNRRICNKNYDKACTVDEVLQVIRNKLLNDDMLVE